MVRTTIKILALTVLTLMILSTIPSFVTATQPEWQAEPMHHATPQVNLGYYYPADIQKAYNLPTDGGSGKTIAIIDAYANPTVQTDMDAFSNNFKIPSTTVEVYPATGISYDANWALEINLDVQWAHAIAPSAHILLVEAKSNSLTDLLSAVDYAVTRQDVVAVSMSWGGPEFLQQTSYDNHFASNTVEFFASSGDNGAGVSWPSSSINVVSVGGTTLNYDTVTQTVISETAWTGSGGGISRYEPKPAYQSSLSYSRRATPDVSYCADPNSGFLVRYNNAWYNVGGTSAGAPQWAAIYAIGLSATNTNFYADYKQGYGNYFRDITSGSNGYRASTGYDLATGLGSPTTTSFAPKPDFAVSTSPSSLTISAGSSGTTLVTVTAVGGFSSEVTITTSPTGWAVPDPISITPTSSAQLTLNVPVGTAPGTYTITVTGTSGTTTHDTPITITVPKPDFSLTSNPSSLTISRGSTGKSTITLNALNNYAGSAALTATGLPRGVTVKFSPDSVSAGVTSAMSITVTSSASRQTSTITITGTDASGLMRTASIRLTVK